MAADIMKIGLVRLRKALKKRDLDAYPVLTVHDSVMLEVSETIPPAEIVKFLDEQLCFDIDGYPELEIDVKVGSNWHDMSTFEPDSPEPPPKETFEVIEKNVALPSGVTKEDLSGLPGLLKGLRAGNISVSLMHAERVLTTVQTDPEGYQKILRFLLGASKDGTTPTVPTVSFA